MSAERLTFEAGTPQGSSWAIPESFKKALDDVRPDGLDWKRLEGAMAVLKGEKEAVVPKPPEPEPTESQKFWRDMLRMGKLSPYQSDRPSLLKEENLNKVREAWKNPESQGEANRIMAIDMAIRGGADKEYNQIGSVKHRAKRSLVLIGNMLPAIADDILLSIPPQFLVNWRENVINKKLANTESLKVGEANKLQRQKNALRGLIRAGEIWNDKDVTGKADKRAQKLTGLKVGFTDEVNDKAGDLVNAAAKDKIADVVNGPVIESLMRIIYQIPVGGALFEQTWTRLSLFMRSSPLVKGRMKAVFMGIGYYIGATRDVDNKPPRSASKWIADKVWEGAVKLFHIPVAKVTD